MDHADGDAYRPVPGYLHGMWPEVLKTDRPSRHEVVALSTIVLATVATLTTSIFGLDAVFAKAIVRVLT